MILERCEPKMQICNRLDKATSFKHRLFGLIGKREMNDYGMLFPNCNWIHTFFMSIPIDVIYVDKKMKIKKIDHELKPWRFAMPVLNASSVIEIASGKANELKLQVGEELHVGH
ncbi:MAG: DUF192 domain-containing protein [Bdellovibrionaceae bacterium]|nr:DUF192 domain-containing protein [Pseudobdellovibrionaceae bacterium]